MKYLFIIIILCSISLLANDKNQDQSKFTNIGLQKGHPIKVSPEELKHANENVYRALQNSDPKVKAALIKASKDLAEKNKPSSGVKQ
jgi:hypothetical protein